MPKIVPTRTPMREQLPEERIYNFDEVPFGYTPEEAIAEAERCLQCKKPGCVPGCPVGIDITAEAAALREAAPRASKSRGTP